MDEERDAEFRAYFASRLPALLRLAYLLAGDAADAEDLAQTALARAFVAWGRVRTSDTPDAYVRRILVNAHSRRFRRRRVGETLMSEVPDGSTHPGGLADVEDRVGLAAALAVLPTRQRAVVVLRYCEDLPEVQVAAILGCSVGTVKTHASRGLARLRADPTLRAFVTAVSPSASPSASASPPAPARTPRRPPAISAPDDGRVRHETP
ncbi:SigE family RNA polymerase sigma factor [Frankia sp. QA3]|uniref:SigE family RNA polymerase sigma factor n=1 Tax=Frankia sp. QA3 TaxID=710111 RepID=UPI000269BF5C|nr:SigE family RNA polymerase sigma factor [Frankia sp. QA3]EIV92425.1 RNA polymerase sigma-70 factor, sigma-E family [Frankia sp. QA3]